MEKNDPKQYRLCSRAINFLAISSTHNNANNVDILAIDEFLDRQRFTDACLSLIEDYIILQCVLKKNWTGYYWQQTDLRPIIEFVSLGSDTIDSMDDYLFERFCQCVIDPWREVPIRFYIYETATRTYLQVISSHLIADGRSCVILIRELLQRYQTLKTKPLPPRQKILPQGLEETFLSTTQLSKRFALYGHLIKKIGLELIQYPTRILSRQTSHASFRMHFLKTDYGAKLLEDNLAYARAHQLTFHTLLLQALAKALIATKMVANKKRIKIMDTFCLRRFAPDSLHHAYGLYMVPHPVDIVQNEKHKASAQVLHQIFTKLKKGQILCELQRQTSYASAAYFLPYCGLKYLVKAVSKMVVKTDICLTNLGALESWMIRGEDTLPIQNYCVYSTLFADNQLAMVASSRDEGLQMTFVANQNTLSLEQIKQLSEQLQIALQGYRLHV